MMTNPTAQKNYVGYKQLSVILFSPPYLIRSLFPLLEILCKEMVEVSVRFPKEGKIEDQMGIYHTND